MSKDSISFSKTMIKSNISNRWQLVLPKTFCDAHLPCHDDIDFTLVDESEREYKVVFLKTPNKFGRGWRDFVTAQGLLEGDRVSFHLIGRCKFKVHVTRASRFTENEFQNDVPVSLGKRIDLTEETTCFGDTVTKKYLVSCVEMQDKMLSQIKKRVHEEVVSKEKVYMKSPHRSTETNCTGGNQYLNLHDCSNDDEHTRIVKKMNPAMDVHATKLPESECDSTTLASVEHSEPDLKLKGFEDFNICVNGEVLDSEIPLDIRMKYYQLCCGQKKFIHDRVMKSLNSKLVVAMILEIVRIADATKSASISTSPQDLELMGKALNSFQDLGMAVGSLRAKIFTLTTCSSEHLIVEESTKAKLAEIEMETKALVEKKSKLDDLIENVLEHSELIEELEVKIDALRKKREKLCFVFQEVAGLTCGKLKIMTTVDKREPSDGPYSLKIQSSKIQENMSRESVSFSRIMLKSNVSNHPWQLPLPKKFCDAHLPCHNNDVILVDESEQEHKVVFLTVSHRLGCGWRSFATAHGLLEGDILSFEMIDRCKFKVHITRASRSAENELQNNVLVDVGERKYLTEENTGFAVGSLRAKMDTLTKFSSEHQRMEGLTSVMSEIEREMAAFQEKKLKIDELIRSAMAQYGELVGDLRMKIDAQKEKREKIGFVFKKLAVKSTCAVWALLFLFLSQMH